MQTMIRTSITFPADLYEALRLQAFSQRTSVSQLIREKVFTKAKKRIKQAKAGQGIEALLELSKLTKGSDLEFDRKKFYDDLIKHKMSFGF